MLVCKAVQTKAEMHYSLIRRLTVVPSWGDKALLCKEDKEELL